MRVRTIGVLDEVVRDGASVVLHDGQVLQLSVIPTLVRALAADWTDLGELARAVEEVVGPAPSGGAETLLAGQVEELTRLGLVEVSE